MANNYSFLYFDFDGVVVALSLKGAIYNTLKMKQHMVYNSLYCKEMYKSLL